MKKLLLAFIFFSLAQGASAQAWKTVRHEVSFGVGASNFLGDLGGAKSGKNINSRILFDDVTVGQYMNETFFAKHLKNVLGCNKVSAIE